MKPNTLHLRQVWDVSSRFFSNEAIEIDRKFLDELISSIFTSGPYCFFIIDFTTLTIKYASQSIRDIHGLDPNDVIIDDILNLIHPEDMDFVAKAEDKVFDILYKQVPKEKIPKYKMSYCFRCIKADGTYGLFNHQALAITVDNEGRVSMAINIHTEISHLTSSNNYKLSMIGIMGEPTYTNIDVIGDHQVNFNKSIIFSRREKDVIKLLSEGLTTSAIAEKLFIAHNTVKNHRKNILHKASCKNVTQLISRCLVEGLI